MQSISNDNDFVHDYILCAFVNYTDLDTCLLLSNMFVLCVCVCVFVRACASCKDSTFNDVDICIGYCIRSGDL